ncbi:hypothetical protein cypCar_00046166 [Cyprinus carpio]|nr:hypothetical protein cypCar_00046166 [Cyprinus carpio]
MRGVVEVNPVMGKVKVMGVLDYEEASSHELDVQAKDGGGQSSHCKLIIDVIDVNDNAPVIAVKSTLATVPEDASLGAMVALLHVYDLDTGTSGRVTCEISDVVPFKLVSEVKNYLMLVIDGVLDLEMWPHYNITVTAMDAGTHPLFRPSFTSTCTVQIFIADQNDNAPVIFYPVQFDGYLAHDIVP